MRVTCNLSKLSLTIAWVLLSKALVASSKSKIRGFNTKALAIRSRSQHSKGFVALSDSETQSTIVLNLTVLIYTGDDSQNNKAIKKQ
jgi:hypothetical protein